MKVALAPISTLAAFAASASACLKTHLVINNSTGIMNTQVYENCQVVPTIDVIIQGQLQQPGSWWFGEYKKEGEALIAINAAGINNLYPSINMLAATKTQGKYSVFNGKKISADSFEFAYTFDPADCKPKGC